MIMKTIIKIFVAGLMLSSIVACSSNTVNMEPVALDELDPDECLYDGTDMRAPAWTCGFPVKGYPVTGVGIFRPTKAGNSFARAQAAMDARVNIATEIKAKIGSMVKSYAETTGIGDFETVDAVASSTQRQITAEVLHGAQVLRYVKDPNGNTYALVTLDEARASEIAKSAMLNSYKNSNAQWQRFLGEKSQEELEREMDKMIHGEF